MSRFQGRPAGSTNSHMDSSASQLSPHDLLISSSSSLSPPSGVLPTLVNGNGNGHNYGTRSQPQPLPNHTGSAAHIGGKAAPVEWRHQKLLFISIAQPFAPTAIDGGIRAPSRLQHRAKPQAASLLNRADDVRRFRTAGCKAQFERSAGGFAGNQRVIF